MSDTGLGRAAFRWYPVLKVVIGCTIKTVGGRVKVESDTRLGRSAFHWYPVQKVVIGCTIKGRTIKTVGDFSPHISIASKEIKKHETKVLATRQQKRTNCD